MGTVNGETNNCEAFYRSKIRRRKINKNSKRWLQRWNLHCSWRSHGTKSAILESKLRTGTSKTKKMQICLDEVALFWLSQWTACSPAWRILYHVTASCKGPITSTEFDLLLLSKGHCFVRLSSVGRSRSKVKAGLVAMNDFSFSTKEIRSKFLAFDKNNFALFPVTHENSPLGISFIAPDFHVFLAQTTRLKKLNSKEPERTRGCWVQNEEIN